MRTIWYMGAKTRMAGEILQAIATAAPCAESVLDLMSGTGVVSQSLAPNYRVVANDVQAYSAAIARAYLESPPQRAFLGALDFEADLGAHYVEHRDALLEALSGAVALEDAFLQAYGLEPEAVDPLGGTVLPHASSRRELTRARRRVPRDASELAQAYRAFALNGTPCFQEDRDPALSGVWRPARELFSRRAIQLRRELPGLFPYLLATTYYPNVYLGIRQAIAVDSLRYAIDKIPSRDRYAAAKRRHYLAALLHAMSVATSATSHFCQPRGLVRDAEVKAVLTRRSLSIPSKAAAYSLEIQRTIAETDYHPNNAVFDLDWRSLYQRWDEVEAQVVYADPPYTADNYSRFYHVLEVLTRYDYPELQRAGRTKGRYPELSGRHRSAFCVRRQVEQEFRDLIAATAERGASLVLSYGEENGLLLKRYREAGDSPSQALKRFTGLAAEAYDDVRLHRQPLLHSGQGDSNHTITELLLVARRPKSTRRRTRRGART